MAGSVQETLPPQQTAKRSAEADPESTPLSKRPSESIEQNQQAQPMDASANLKDDRSGGSPKQQQTAEEGKTSPEPVVPSIENGKSVAEHQPTSAEMNGRKIPEQAPPSDQSGLLNKEGEAPGHGSDPAVVATPGATEAAAEQPEAQEKRAVAMGAPKTLAEDSPAKQGNVEPVVENASKTKSPETSVKSTGEESTQSQPKDAVPQTSAQPTEEKTGAALEKETQVPTAETSVEIPPQQQAPVQDVAFPPPVATLTPANPLPPIASAPLIGNIPPQAVESLQAAAHQAASVLPLQPTQELLGQQISVRTSNIDPADQGVAPMEE
ncbi:uncharacterized protein [Physcomitrium patens]|uniref:Uncharacterized protein n=1 Tax=Physcomitrium patens TaxID=3218 RepID=A0A2K1IUP4_PHYPA|nr:uncharacterized protein LOC112272967 [Physcomitrium patens]XP_024356977.1 uncharacterized protein LOC112272967 [Physcomitrium patens]XP_024356978.1 uncharacterized protein LOC112272967 [Physcomitrium patens]PNR32990.1 hypothetical protein PHYPA_024933 [Physcomitrium patens]|eukprot:XP_024356976.1 uncharacterized protein LOC112272967 [Physcomitrella patens]